MMSFLGPKCRISQKMVGWGDGVLNENGTPHLLSGSIVNAQTPSGQDPSMGWGRGLKEACPCLRLAKTRDIVSTTCQELCVQGDVLVQALNYP